MPYALALTGMSTVIVVVVVVHVAFIHDALQTESQ